MSLEEETFLEEKNLNKYKNEFNNFLANNYTNINCIKNPGPVDNSKFLKIIDEDNKEEYSVNPENYILDLENFKISDHIATISEKQWLFFTSRFSGGPSVQRKAVRFPEDNQRIEIETQLLEVICL